MEDSSRFGERRMTASTTPITMPSVIATSVSSTVTSNPFRTSAVVKYWPTTFQPNRQSSNG